MGQKLYITHMNKFNHPLMQSNFASSDFKNVSDFLLRMLLAIVRIVWSANLHKKRGTLRLPFLSSN